jgi:hypothetical protein
MISSISSFVLADGLSLTEEEKVKLAGNIVKMKNENLELREQKNILEDRIIIERKEADDVIEGLENIVVSKNKIIENKDLLIQNKNKQLLASKTKTVLYVGLAGLVGYFIGNIH